jgi:peptidoglycan/LPS O-acetylase OafA/YrhL
VPSDCPTASPTSTKAALTLVAQDHFPSIDALRGLAALSVVVYHLWLRYFPRQSTQYHPLTIPADHALAFILTLPLQYGYFGVTLFFVISGFCIHLPHARRFAASGDDGLRPRPFAGRRFRRLYPAYCASIVFTSVAMAVFPVCLAVSRGAMPDLVKALGLRDALLNAVFLLPLELTPPGFNGVYWTLMFELQFYAAYPMLLYAARRWGFRRVLVVLLALEALFTVVLTATRVPAVMRYLFVRKWFEWYVGMYAAEEVVAGKAAPARWLAVGGLCLGIVASLHPVLWPFCDLLLSVGFAGVLLVCLRSDVIGRAKPLLTIGVFSYSLYLIHMPVLDFGWTACQLAAKYHLISATTAYLLAPLVLPVALALGYGSYRVFERPFLRGKAGAIRVEDADARPRCFAQAA